MIIRNPQDEYALFKTKQRELASMLDRAAITMGKLNLKNYASNLSQLSQKTQSDSFKIQVVGTFKNGKSTFINSFLGENILPAYALPCTAVINEVKYGETKKAVLHFKNPLPKVLPKELSPITIKHLKRFNMKDIPPLIIPYDRIEEYVVIPMGKDPKEMLLESPYEKVELFWPLELLKNGIEIIDSPGLNEHATRTKVTMDYLSNADAILFVMNATSLCTKEEMTFVQENLKKRGFNDSFFVVNRYDLIPEKEQNQIQKYAHAKLKDYTSFGENGLFFVSAKNALDGKIENNLNKLNSSGLPLLEQSLSEYLIKEKGRMKMLQPARELKRIIYHETLFKILPHRRAMLSQSVTDIKAKYAKIRPVLEALKKKQELFEHHVDLKIEQKRSTYKDMVESNIMHLSSEVPKWLESYIPQTKIGLIPQRKKIVDLTDEISSFIAKKLDDEQKKWYSKTLTPNIKEDLTTLFNDFELNLIKIFDVLEKIQFSISNKKDNAPSSGKKRVAELFEGLALQKYTFIIEKDKNDSFASTVTGKADKATAAFITECLSPASACSSILNSFLSYGKDSNIVLKAKDRIQNDTMFNLRSKASEIADILEEEIMKSFKEILHRISDAIIGEISQCENQILTVIHQVQKVGGKVFLLKNHLETCESEIKIIGMELDKLTFEID